MTTAWRKRGRPRFDRPSIDQGTPEQQARRRALAGGGDPALTEHPLGICSRLSVVVRGASRKVLILWVLCLVLFVPVRHNPEHSCGYGCGCDDDSIEWSADFSGRIKGSEAGPLSGRRRPLSPDQRGQGAVLDLSLHASWQGPCNGAGSDGGSSIGCREGDCP
jgi:hypothetical protein